MFKIELYWSTLFSRTWQGLLQPNDSAARNETDGDKTNLDSWQQCVYIYLTDLYIFELLEIGKRRRRQPPSTRLTRWIFDCWFFTTASKVILMGEESLKMLPSLAVHRNLEKSFNRCLICEYEYILIVVNDSLEMECAIKTIRIKR